MCRRGAVVGVPRVFPPSNRRFDPFLIPKASEYKNPLHSHICSLLFTTSLSLLANIWSSVLSTLYIGNFSINQFPQSCTENIVGRLKPMPSIQKPHKILNPLTKAGSTGYNPMKIQKEREIKNLLNTSTTTIRFPPLTQQTRPKSH